MFKSAYNYNFYPQFFKTCAGVLCTFAASNCDRNHEEKKKTINKLYKLLQFVWHTTV